MSLGCHRLKRSSAHHIPVHGFARDRFLTWDPRKTKSKCRVLRNGKRGRPYVVDCRCVLRPTLFHCVTLDARVRKSVYSARFQCKSWLLVPGFRFERGRNRRLNVFHSLSVKQVRVHLELHFSQSQVFLSIHLNFDMTTKTNPPSFLTSSCILHKAFSDIVRSTLI